MIQKSFEIDGIKLDPTNKEFFEYAQLVLKDTQRRVVYLTGKAGTGKTTFLKYVVSEFERQNQGSETPRSYVILAPTGVAAVNAHGQTIHSFFKLPSTAFLPEDEQYEISNIKKCFSYNNEKVELIKHLSLLIIDEISMVRCDILDIIDKILKAYRKDNRPFGGVKVLLVGDAFQLSPIASGQVIDKKTNTLVSIKYLLQQQGYKSIYFFDSKAYIESEPFQLELTKPYRQQEFEFIDLLNKVRINELKPEDIISLNKRCCEPTELAREDIIHLAPLNRIVDAYNQQQYDALEGDEKEYQASIQGDFPEKIMPVESLIKLKIGAQVMIRRNHFDNDGLPQKTYYNGTIGKIEHFDDDYISIKSKNPLTNEDVRYVIEKCTWENIEYTWNRETKLMEEKVLGSFTQFPIKIAWAITIHKSQGLTFDHVMLSLRDCFAPGQAYVALSRCRRLNGIFLDNPISPSIFQVDPRVVAEIKKTTSRKDVEIYNNNTDANNLYALARKSLMDNQPDKMLKYYNDACKHRNDYDTKEFNKYIGHIVKLLHRYKEHRNILLKEQQENLAEIEKINEQFALLETAHQTISQQYNGIIEELANAKIANNQQQKNIVEQVNKIEILNQLIANERTASAVEKAVLTSKIDGYKEVIQRHEMTIENKQRTIIDLSNQNSKIQGEKELIDRELVRTAQELERVRQIKWWQKLFGKK